METGVRMEPFGGLIYQPFAAQHHRCYVCEPHQILGVARSSHLYGYPESINYRFP